MTARLRSLAVRGWLAAVLVYVTAVFHRASLGVAGLDAAERYGISASALSVFVLVQLGVYAAMQVPTGVLVDRFGPRRMLLIAASTMGVAQLLFSIAPSYPTALGARTLLGAGDALTFISVVRYATLHFSPRRFAVIIALTGTLGSVGNILATIPLSAALQAFGWTPSFAVAACVSGLAAAGVWLLMPAEPAALGGATRFAMPAYPGATLRRIGVDVGAAWREPGTRAGFWVHFSTMSFTTMFGVLWGMPYLVAQGFTRSEASAMLTVAVVGSLVSSPIVGAVFGRFRAARMPFAMFVSFATIAGWSALMFGFDGGTPPRGLLAIAIALTAVGGPTSAIGFALARDYNPVSVVGTASGLVNVGGFTSAIVCAVVVGRVLDLAGGSTVDSFRIAFGMALVVQAIGAVQAVRWYRRLRVSVLEAQRRGEVVPVPVTRHRWDLEPAAA